MENKKSSSGQPNSDSESKGRNQPNKPDSLENTQTPAKKNKPIKNNEKSNNPSIKKKAREKGEIGKNDEKDEGETWVKKNLDLKSVLAGLALIVSVVNLCCYYTYNSKSNAVLDYVGLANFGIHPRSSVYKTMSDADYDKVKWTNDPDDLWWDNTHKFIYYFEVYDSTKHILAIPHSRSYEMDKIKKLLDTPYLRGDSFGIMKVYEPKMEIRNNGQSPARDFTYKIGLKQSGKPTNYWEPLTHQLGPIEFPGRDSLFPPLQFSIKYNVKLTDTFYYRVRMHYKTILKDPVDTNFYIIWFPPNDGWYYDNEIRKKYGSEPFQDETEK